MHFFCKIDFMQDFFPSGKIPHANSPSFDGSTDSGRVNGG